MKYYNLKSNLTIALLSTVFLVGSFLIYLSIKVSDQDYSSYFLIIGLSIVVPFLISLSYIFLKDSHLNRNFKNQEIHRIKSLKETGEKILIDLDKLKIKSEPYTIITREGNETYNGIGRSFTEGYDVNRESVTNLNNVSLKVKYNSKNYMIERQIIMDTDKLKMFFHLQKQTFLYIDLKDKTNIFLDLDFLNN